MKKLKINIAHQMPGVIKVDCIELMRLMKLYLQDKVVVCWNALSELEVLPYIDAYSLGIHDCMIRFSRVANRSFNSNYQDRPFLDLKSAASIIGRSEELDWHNPLSDAAMTGILWKHCDKHNFPRDYLVSLEIENNLNNLKPQQLYLELTEDEIEFNHQARLDHRRHNRLFKKPKPSYQYLEGYSDARWIEFNKQHKSLNHVFLDIESFRKDGKWLPKEVVLYDADSDETLIHVIVEHKEKEQ